ncbi:MAG TPA: BamA/TamA family outer membrane protein, partial [Allosphingosinicella sp.]|nr:BamA/TamA family outer membrane protein [Allosphingosinicella sp.]
MRASDGRHPRLQKPGAQAPTALSELMAFGRTHYRHAGRAAVALVLSLCALAPAAYAQGRVPVENIPPPLRDELKRLQRDEPAPATLFDAQRQADRAEDVVRQFLESEGYYQAEVDGWAEAGNDNAITHGVHVTLGPLFTFAARQVDYLDAPPDEETQAALEKLLEPVAVGAPARAEVAIQVGDKLVAGLKDSGYPDARADPADALADAETQTIELTYKLQPGQRASFGAVTVSGLVRTKEDYIAGLRPWTPNERYTPEKMDEFRARLAETGLFETASAKLAPEGEPQANGTLQRDIEVTAKERKRRTIALGASASTSDGYGVDAEWELRNLAGRGESLTYTAQIATLERRLQTTWRRPNIGKYGRNLRIAAEVEDFETDAFDQSGGNVSATVEEQLTKRVRASLGVEVGYASILDAEAKATGAGRRDLYLLNGTATTEYIGVRDVLDPQSGVRARLAIEPGFTWGDTNIGYTKVTAEGSLYGRMFKDDDWVGALRGKVGTIAGPNGAPPDRLFFAGGGGSVRGYEYQSL